MLLNRSDPTPARSLRVDSHADVTVLIHVGPHKTGTTWLQNALLAEARGIVYEPDCEPSHRAFLHPPYGEFRVEVARSMFDEQLRRARDEEKPLVISDEALGGRPFGQRFLREIAAERIRLTFPEARILITIREQDAVILSMYSEYLRYGYSSSLRAFLEQETGSPNLLPTLDLAYYDWSRMMDLYSDLFSPEQVLALPMEWGLKDSGNYPAALERFLGMRLDIPEGVNVLRPERPSMSGWALQVLRYANRTRPQDTRYLHGNGPFAPNSLAWRVDRATPNWARRRSKRRMRRIVREMIGETFAASNSALQDRIEFNLASLSYRMLASDSRL